MPVPPVALPSIQAVDHLHPTSSFPRWTRHFCQLRCIYPSSKCSSHIWPLVSFFTSLPSSFALLLGTSALYPALPSHLHHTTSPTLSRKPPSSTFSASSPGRTRTRSPATSSTSSRLRTGRRRSVPFVPCAQFFEKRLCHAWRSSYLSGPSMSAMSP